MISSIKGMWPQWFAGAATTLLVIDVGIITGWTSPYLPKLMVEGSSLSVTAEEASWIASLVNVSRLIGGIAGAIGSRMLGAKMTNLLAVLPAGLCWVLTIFANSASWLCAARLSGGLSFGMAFTSIPLYIGEIADPKTRGALVSLAVTGAPIGNALVSLIGSVFDIVESSVAFLVGSFLLALIFVWLPESPHHLVKVSKIEEAKASIAWYHRECNVDAEYAELENFIVSWEKKTLYEYLGEFRRAEIQRATFVMLGLNFFVQMSGLNNIIFYMATILTHAKVTFIEPSMCATIIMSFGILSAIASISLIDRLGRRVLLVCSSMTLAIALIALEIHFTVIEAGYESKSIQWLPIVALILSEIAIYLGLTPIRSTVLSELFPPNIKHIASCGVGVLSAIIAFICTKTYQPLVDLMGEQYVYWINIVIELMATPFALFIMPETKDMTISNLPASLCSIPEKNGQHKPS